MHDFQYTRHASFYIDIFEILCVDIGISSMLSQKCITYGAISNLLHQFDYLPLIINFLIQPRCLSYSYKLLILCYRSTSLHEENTMKFSRNKNIFEQKQQENEKELKKRWSDIAKDWQRNKRDVKVFQLAEFGIPISARKQVWPLIVGNKLQITKELYNILQIQSKTFKLDQRKSLGRLSSFNHIKQDLGRTFKNESLQKIFHPGGPLSENLQTILEVFCLYRPDIGYVQGMTYIGSILLTYFDDYQAFIILSSLITHPQLISIFMLDEHNLQIIFQQFEKLIKLNIPQVYKLFKQHNINCTNYLLDWILTLFAKPLNPDIVGRIWDRMLFNGTHILWKCGIAILKIQRINLRFLDILQQIKIMNKLYIQLG